MFCPKCGKEQNGNEVFCSSCGTNMNGSTATNSSSTEDAGTGLKIISFLIPLVGGIMFLAWHKDYPVKAKSCGMFALGGFILNIILLAAI